MITVGSRVGGYTVLHLLGQGGMGQVFLAQHHRIARRAAVKVLLPELSANESAVERFFTEARATSLIRHPGIVEILDCDVRDGQAYVVMEHLEGESLADYLERTGGLAGDVPFALAVVSRVAQAVGAAHSAGIVHRDLKPDNVFLSVSNADGRIVPKILDFGIAKLAEQRRGGGKVVDGRADVYSLGCILYEMLCAVPPFLRKGIGDLIVAHASEAPEPPHTHVPSISPALDRLVMQMLAKAPADRPQTMEAVAGELADCLAALGARAPLPDVRPRKPVVIPVLPEHAPTVAEWEPVHSTATDTPSSSIRNAVGEKTELVAPRRSSFARATMMMIAVLGIGGVGALVALRGQIFASATTAEPDPPSAALEARTPLPDKVTIDLQGLPPGAQVLVDGAAAGALPLKLARDDRRHQLVVHAPGREPTTIELDATRDRVVELELAPLVPAATAAPQPPEPAVGRTRAHDAKGRVRDGRKRADVAGARRGLTAPTATTSPPPTAEASPPRR